MTPQEQAFQQLTGGAPPPGVTLEGADAAFEQLTGRKPSASVAAAPPAPPVEPESAAARRTRDVVGGMADVVDMLVAGTPALVGGAFAETVNRVQGIFDSRSRKQIAEEGAAQSAAIGEMFGTPVRSALTNAGYLRKNEPGAIQQGLEKAMGLLERDAAAVEERTGGKVLKQDYMMFVNGLFAMAGVAGTGVGTKAVLSNAKAKAAAKELDRMVASRRVEMVAAEELTAKTPTTVELETGSVVKMPSPEEQSFNALTSKDVAAGLKSAELMREESRLPVPPETRQAQLAEAKLRRQRREDVRAAFAEDPYATDATVKLAEGEAERRAAAEAEQSRLSLQGEMTPRTRPPQATLVDEVPRTLQQNAFGDLTVAAPASLESGLAKVKRGRLFDLTSEERIAIRGATKVTDPKIVTAAAVGATGLGLAMALEPDAEEAALAIGAGALVMGRGKGLTLEALKAMPDTASLGTILEPSAYTLGVIEQLPKNHFKFPKATIEQLLKQDKVTGAERTILQGVLESTPGETITAKQLMAGVKEATGDFELKVRETQEYANYGLDNINRVKGLDDWVPDTPGNAGVSVKPVDAPPAATRIWQSPVELGTNNHFDDPNYFGHTRSFDDEKGVRHVVELQSDLAQKAGKVLSAEERALLESELATDRKVLADAKEAFAEASKPMQIGLRGVIRRSEMRIAETQAKLTQIGKVESISPMLKNWHKRLIREEIADVSKERSSATEKITQTQAQITKEQAGLNALRRNPDATPAFIGVVERAVTKLREELTKAEQQAGQQMIRFADADTVAKVEGWPKAEMTGDMLLDRELQNARSQIGIRGPESVNLHGERYADVIDRIKKHPDYQPGRFSKEHQGIYDRYAGDVTKFLKQLGGKHVVDEAGHGWWEVPLEGSKQTPAGKRVQQFGGVDQKLVGAIAAVGGGAFLAAALSDENKTRKAIVGGAIAGLAALAVSGHPGVRSWAKAAGHTAEIALGNTSTTVRGMSMPLLRRASTFEMDVLKRTHDRMVAVAPFSTGFRKLADGPTKDALRSAVTTNDAAATLRILGQVGDPKLLKGWREARRVLDEVGRELQAIGRLDALRPDYFPRMVIDHEGLLNSLGLDLKTGLQKILHDADRASQIASGLPLTALERTKLINKYLAQQGGTGKGRPGFLKQRKIGDVDEALVKFYAPPDEAIILYLRGATKEIEQAKFFGRHAIRDPATGRMVLEASVGNVVESELTAGRIKPEQAESLRQVLRDRHGPGEKAMNPKLAAIRDLTYMGLLGNVFSALVQTGDTAIAMAAHNTLPTMNAILGKLTRRSGMTKVADLGLVNHISEEMATTSKAAKMLNKTFKLSGFSYVDQAGKSIAVNAARIKWRGKLRTPEGERAFRKEYGDYFGDDMDALIRDLRADEPTRLVHELLFRELSDLQPISKLEMPQLYLRHPNGRVFYMLHTFGLKQVDIFRRKVVQQALRGDRLGALNNLLRFGIALGASGATTQFINNLLLGRDDKLEANDVFANVFRTFGYSEYAMSKPSAVDKVSGTVGQVLPPYKIWAEIVTADPKALQYLPVTGRFLHNRGEFEVGDMKLGGGAKKYNEWQAKRERADLRKEEKKSEKRFDKTDEKKRVDKPRVTK